MNKKISLGIGATLLTAIPLVAIVSCTQSSEKSINEIDNEAKKFNITVETTKKDLVSTDVVNNMNTALDASLELKSLVSSLPTIDNKFDFRVKNTSLKSTENTTIEVSIIVFEKADTSNERSAIYSIEGFTAPSEIIDIEDQVKLFDNSITIFESTVDPQVLVDAVNGASSSQEKLNVIKGYVNVPTLDDAFELEVLSAIVREGVGGVRTTVDVSLKIIERANPNIFRNVTLKIEGFQSIDDLSDINLEIAKFGSRKTKSPNTPAFKVVDEINSVDEDLKIHSLALVADIPTLAYGYDFKVKSASLNSNNKSIINVLILIFNINKPDISVETTYEISDFQISDLDTEAAKFVNTTTSSNLSSFEVVDAIQAATSPGERFSILNNVTQFPELEDGFSFEIDWAIVDKANKSAILVIVSISKDDSIDSLKTIVYSIDGFKISTIEIEKNKFNNPITTNNVEADIDELVNQIMNSVNNVQKLEIIEGFVDLPELAYGFELEIRSAQKFENAIEIDAIIRETNTLDASEIFKIIISGFELIDLQSELDFESAKFTNPVQTKNLNLYSEQAANSINSAATNDDKLYALLLIADVPTLKDGFGMTVLSTLDTTNNPGSVFVVIEVFNIRDSSMKNTVTFVVSGFRIKSLDTEAEKFVDATTNTPERVSYKVVEDILDANTTTRKELLNEIMTVPQLEGDNGFNFDFVVEWVMVDRNDAKNILVT
ncbi:MAG: hypothetical protein ACRDCH_02310, partial [Metamycoplasmataceae bacterium]